MTRYAYLGPQGTFTEMALRSWAPAEGAVHGRWRSVDAALAAVRAGERRRRRWCRSRTRSRAGSAPRWTRSPTASRCVVVGEVLVPITFVLAAPAGTPLASVRPDRHPPARLGPGPRLDGRSTCPTRRTSRPCPPRPVPRGWPPARASYDAAVCAPVAAADHGLTVLAEGIGDNASAVTRFVLVSRPGVVPEPTGADKTTLVALPDRRPPRRPARAAGAVRRPRGQPDAGWSRGRRGSRWGGTASRSTSRVTSGTSGWARR